MSTPRWLNGDTLTGLLGLLLAAGAWWAARDLPLQSLEQGLGAALFPWLVIAVIALLAIACLGRGLARAQGGDPDAGDPDVRAMAGLRRSLPLAAALVIYGVLFHRIGFLPSTAGFVAIATWLLGASVPAALATAALTAGALHLLFAVALGVPLP